MTKYTEEPHGDHSLWNGLKKGDSCFLPSGARGIVLGMDDDGRINVRYLDTKARRQLVSLPGKLLKLYVRPN